MSKLTLDELRASLPDAIKKTVTDDVLNNINKTIGDPAFYQQYRENLLSYANVLQAGKFKIGNYVDAVRYVSYKLMGLNNQEAYIKTFPDRYNYFMQKGTSAKDISSYVHAYHNNKLVNMVMEQAIIPVHILGKDLFWKAVNEQANIMMSATSEKVRSDAANSIMSHLKPPETKKHEIDVTVKDDGTLESLRQAVGALVQEQEKVITSGVATAGQIAGGRIIEGEKV